MDWQLAFTYKPNDPSSTQLVFINKIIHRLSIDLCAKTKLSIEHHLVYTYKPNYPPSSNWPRHINQIIHGVPIGLYKNWTSTMNPVRHKVLERILSLTTRYMSLEMWDKAVYYTHACAMCIHRIYSDHWDKNPELTTLFIHVRHSCMYPFITR